jgi:hypothetical protein
MTLQKWIVSNSKRLFATVHLPEQKTNNGILLLSGFSHSVCDIDYFMSRLANILVKNNNYIIQVDPYGIGDSDGKLENVTFDTLKQDVKTSVDYLCNMKFKNIFCISRGIMSLIVDNVVYENNYKCKLIHICPTDIIYCKKLHGTIQNLCNDECFDIAILDDDSKKKSIMDFMNSLGAKDSNVLGQKVNLKALLESTLKSMYYINPFENNCVKTYFGKTESGENDYLPRNFQWQNNVIIDITQYILETCN